MQHRALKILLILTCATFSVVSVTGATNSSAATQHTARTSSSQAVPAPVQMPGGFRAVHSIRLLDTRGNIGALGPVQPQHSVNVEVAGTSYEIPPNGVGAAVVNVTVTHTQSSGYLTAYPANTTRPTVSNVNFLKGQTVANLATVRVQDGKISIYNGSAGTVDIVVDIAGYYLSGTAADPGAFQTLAPARVLDTRIGLGANKAPVPAAGTLTLTVGGHGLVPASGVRAVVLTLTATRAASTGYVTAYPTGSTRPTASNLNFVAGATVPNMVTTAVSSTGKVSLYNGSSRSIDLIADVAGYYLAGAPTMGGAFVPITPTRYLDTRSKTGVQFGPLFGGNTASVQVLYTGGTGSGHIGGVPLDNVSAVATNVTTTGEQTGGYITAYPLDVARDAVSTMNYAKATTRANAAITRVGTCGQISYYNGSGGSTGLIADASGYFLAADATAPTTPTDRVHAFGGDQYGALGNGSFGTSVTPVTAVGVSDVTGIAAGQHVLAIRSDTTVEAWGVNGYGELGTGQAMGDDQGHPGCAIPVMVPELADVTAVAAGSGTSYALKSYGNVWSWGMGDGGQLGDGTTDSSFTATHQVSDLTDVTAIAAGPAYALALKSDGTVWGWGSEFYGELGTGKSVITTPVQIAPATLTDIVAISAGNVDSYALTSDGHVYAWGANLFGELGDGTAADSDAHPDPVLVSGLSTVTQVSAGPGETVLVRLTDGTVRSWGMNERGNLGNGQDPNVLFSSNVPVTVSGLSNVTSISTGAQSEMALESDGTVWTWGAHPGNGSTTDRSTPAKVAGLTGVTAIAQGLDTGYAIVP